MSWESIKGISTVVDFFDVYMANGPINKSILFNNPDRSKFGYLWDISPEWILGIQKNIGESLRGILITDDMDARVVQGLYNRCFFDANKRALLNGANFKQTGGTLQLSQAALDKIRWDSYYDLLTTLYANDYVPLKKYLSQPVKEKIWIPLFPSTSHMDKMSRKSYYQLIKWIIGNDTIILEIPDKYESWWIWEEAIKGEGPMGNPELLFLEDFATEYPGSIKHIPEKIQDTLNVEPLKDLDYFGITFH
jgi:hypothetical protein